MKLILQLTITLTNPGISLVLKYIGFIAQTGLETEEREFAFMCCSQGRLKDLLETHIDIIVFSLSIINIFNMSGWSNLLPSNPLS